MRYRYEDPEQFAELDRPNLAEHSGNIVLWGAGKIGGITAHILKQQGIEALAFVDTLEAKQGTTFCGLKIISPETFFKYHRNSKLIITTVGRDGVIQQLTDNGFTNFYDAWPLLLDFDFGDYNEHNQMYMMRMIDYYFRVIIRVLNLKDRYVVNRLRLMVTSRCSLRCRECSVFIPCVHNPHDDDWSKIISDITALLDAAGKVHEIELGGGEPLLHQDLHKIITSLKDEERFEGIAIVSNGTIVPSEALVNALKNEPRAIFRLSNYGKLSPKIQEAEQKLTGNGIPCEVIDYKTWYKTSEIKATNETEAQLKRKFNCCMQGHGLVYWSGKLFYCSTLPFLVDANIFPTSDDNFYDARNKDIKREELIKDMRAYIDRHKSEIYIDACRYCSGKTSSNFMNPVPAAAQAQGILKIADINAE